MCKNGPYTKKDVLLMAGAMSIIGILIIAMVVGLTLVETENAEAKDLKADRDENRDLSVVSRLEWVATDSESMTPLQHPIPNVIVFQTRSEGCVEKKFCILYVRHLQNRHMEKLNDTDISYNFLIGGDANAYHGRGWSSASTIVPNCNEHSITIAFIGSYQFEPPSDAQVIALKRLLNKGIKSGYLRQDFRIIGASQILGDVGTTGEALQNEIKKMSEWKSTDFAKNMKMKKSFCNGL